MDVRMQRAAPSGIKSQSLQEQTGDFHEEAIEERKKERRTDEKKAGEEPALEPLTVVGEDVAEKKVIMSGSCAAFSGQTDKVFLFFLHTVLAEQI